MHAGRMDDSGVPPAFPAVFGSFAARRWSLKRYYIIYKIIYLINPSHQIIYL